MKIIFNQLLDQCLKKKPTILVTIISNIGSTPRGSGAFMIVGKSGRISGSIGGGMLEYNAIKVAQDCINQKKGKHKKYRLTNEKSAELGMVCGGNVNLLYSYIDPNEENENVLKAILEKIEENKSSNLRLYYSGEKIEISDKNEKSDKFYLQPLETSYNVFIFGGGHLAQELVPVLSHLNFSCKVIDDRKEFSTQKLFPNAEVVCTMDFSDLEGKLDIKSNDFIIAVTRGHAGDYEVLKYALKTPAYYIGAVGSKAKVTTLNKKLKNDGYSAQVIDRIISPIGLKIKSETPAEIAISIAAQLIEKRAILNIDS